MTNRRYFLFTLAALLIMLAPGKLRAQTDPQLDELAVKTCDCITKKNPDYNNQNELQAQLGICMLEAAGTIDIKFDNWTQDEFRVMGEKVGIRMATKCPAVFESFAKSAAKEDDAEIEVKGKVKDVELHDLATIVLREESGKEHRLLWINYFNGSDDFAADPKALVTKKVVITYQLMDIYVVKTKGYITSKVVTKLAVE